MLFDRSQFTLIQVEHFDIPTDIHPLTFHKNRFTWMAVMETSCKMLPFMFNKIFSLERHFYIINYANHLQNTFIPNYYYFYRAALLQSNKKIMEIICKILWYRIIDISLYRTTGNTYGNNLRNAFIQNYDYLSRTAVLNYHSDHPKNTIIKNIYYF